MGSAITVTINFLLTTMTSNSTSAESAPVWLTVAEDADMVAFAVTLTVDMPTAIALTSTLPPDCFAVTASPVVVTS